MPHHLLTENRFRIADSAQFPCGERYTLDTPAAQGWCWIFHPDQKIAFVLAELEFSGNPGFSAAAPGQPFFSFYTEITVPSDRGEPLRPNTLYYCGAPDPRAGGKCRGCWILFQPEQLRRFLFARCGLLPILPRWDLSRVNGAPDQGGEVAGILKQMEAPGFSSPLAEAYYSEKVTELLLLFLRAGEFYGSGEMAGPAPSDPRDEEQIARAIAGMKENLSADVNQLAAVAHMSRRKFTGAFRNSTGMTVQQYRDLLRILLAETLLADPQIPVSEIAARLGFRRSSSFSEFFRTHRGVSPKAYRKNLSNLRSHPPD